MPRYIAKYAHSTQGAREGLEHGWGSATVETDLPVVTAEHKREVARTIGRQSGFTTCALLALIPDPDDG